MKIRHPSFGHRVSVVRVIPALILAAGCPVAIGQTLTWDGECVQSASNAWAASCPGHTNWDPDEIPDMTRNASISNAAVLGIGDNAANQLTQSGVQPFLLPSNGRLTLFGSSSFDTIEMGSSGQLVAMAPVTFNMNGTLGVLKGPGPFKTVGDFTLIGQIGDGPAGLPPAVLNNSGNLTIEHVFLQCDGMIVNTKMIQLKHNPAGGTVGSGSPLGVLHNMGGDILIEGEAVITGAEILQTEGTITISKGGSWRTDGRANLKGGRILVSGDAQVFFRGETIFNGLTAFAGDGQAIFDSGPTGSQVFKRDTSFFLLPANNAPDGLVFDTIQIDIDLGVSVKNLGTM